MYYCNKHKSIKDLELIVLWQKQYRVWKHQCFLTLSGTLICSVHSCTKYTVPVDFYNKFDKISTFKFMVEFSVITVVRNSHTDVKFD